MEETPVSKTDEYLIELAEKMKFVFSPRGPSNVSAASLDPRAKFVINPSLLPSFCLNERTELKPFARFDGNAPE